MAGGPVHLYRLDARHGLRTLPPRSIDVLITDPPYETVDRHGGNSAYLQRWFKGLSWREITEVLRLARSRMRTHGVALVMTNPDGLGPALEAMHRAGFARVRPIAWNKQYPGVGFGLRHQTEYILAGLQPGSRALTGVDVVSVKAVGPSTANRYPTQKPEQLGRVLARMAGVARGELVVDPFCGSGSLLVGAHERGARVIGFDVAGDAIRNATARLR